MTRKFCEKDKKDQTIQTLFIGSLEFVGSPTLSQKIRTITKKADFTLYELCYIMGETISTSKYKFIANFMIKRIVQKCILSKNEDTVVANLIMFFSQEIDARAA